MAIAVCGETCAVEEDMSLLSNAMEACTMIDKRSVSDGRGGTIKRWVDGASFSAAITLDSSTEAKIAEAQGVKSLYTVTTTKAVNLEFHEVFRREEDGKIFRVTSDGDDKKTPKGAGLNMRQVSAEEWKIPTEPEEE